MSARMEQSIEPEKRRPPFVQPSREQFHEINSFFDKGILVARRSAELLAEMESPLLRLFLLLHLAFDLWLFLTAVMIFGLVVLWKLH
jgi:hypothetical protein